MDGEIGDAERAQKVWEVKNGHLCEPTSKPTPTPPEIDSPGNSGYEKGTLCSLSCFVVFFVCCWMTLAGLIYTDRQKVNHLPNQTNVNVANQSSIREFPETH